MRVKLLLMVLSTAASLLFGSMETVLAQSSCPIVIDTSIVSVPGGMQAYVAWDNPTGNDNNPGTGGKKSFMFIIQNGSTTCFSTCIDASDDGTFLSPVFTCTGTPAMEFIAHTGNSTCQGTTCQIQILLPLRLISLTASKKSDGKVEISWNVAAESVNTTTAFYLEESFNEFKDKTSIRTIAIMLPEVGKTGYRYTYLPTKENGLVSYRLRVHENMSEQYSKMLLLRLGREEQRASIGKTATDLLVYDALLNTLIQISTITGQKIFAIRSNSNVVKIPLNNI
ncbi:MAG TPA: hypothetical protein VLB02_00485, partial [Candidatus Paceibacterota bacterium]|nr:hypothetical protein [Candidatus Paceibacterota bacterium]